MARGTFFEVAKEAENLGNMDESQFYGSSYAEWFENEEDPASLEYLFGYFRSVGFETWSDEKGQYVIFSECGKMNYFAHKYEHFKKLLEEADLRRFSTDYCWMHDLIDSITDKWSDAVLFEGTLYDMDEFVRVADIGEKYYFGNTVIAH